MTLFHQSKPGRRLGLVTAAVALFMATAAHAGEWVPTWLASPQPAWGPDNPLPMNLPVIDNQTVRQVARISIGGDRLRLVLSNAYGCEPLIVAKAHVGRSAAEGQIHSGSGQPVNFGGRAAITIPPGAEVVSDPVDMAVSALEKVSVSLYLPGPTPTTTFHWDGKQTTYIANGDVTAATAIKPVKTSTSRLFLSELLVEAKGRPVAVVALGDSITDGASSTVDANRRWTDFLAERLAPRNIAVVNAGISGARVLGDRMGANALARFDREVLAQPNVAAVIVHLGINDISWPGSAYEPTRTAVVADDVIAGFRQMTARARMRKVRIIGTTILPFKGALETTPIWGYYTAEKDRARQAINHWIRTSGAFDDVIDFDAALRDPADPSRLRDDVDGGDHLHPGDNGYKAMADLVDPNVLLGTRSVSPARP